ncbi:phytanoyl-CoA dioxygenase family protein [Candidatus Protochlamydia phocaeensis]|uniref:phytanoyl-CoA dioxygenase family protein n=1 Tax=Candidatus Protochlamydia phocaeensis TaxID=1414722 RepID=UPI0018968F69|nr:phytanoyl-CoA dioxygenase family protein [Candidatus Protochlamydia phocaeensis]
MNEEQITAYQRDGFLVLPYFICADACETLCRRAEELVQAFDDSLLPHLFQRYQGHIPWEDVYLEQGDTLCFFFEEAAFLADGSFREGKERAVKKISYALHAKDPLFQAFSYQPRIQRLLQDLHIADPLILQSMHFFKQPYIGSAVGCHQDAAFLHTAPEPIIGLWFALEDATIDNGCLWVLPGGHSNGLKWKCIKNEQGKRDYEVYDETEWEYAKMVPVEVKKGSLVIMHGYLPHLSEANRSERSRQAFALHVMSGASRYLDSNCLPFLFNR